MPIIPKLTGSVVGTAAVDEGLTTMLAEVKDYKVRETDARRAEEAAAAEKKVQGPPSSRNTLNWLQLTRLGHRGDGEKGKESLDAGRGRREEETLGQGGIPHSETESNEAVLTLL